MHPSQKVELELQARKIIKACDDQIEAAQARANDVGLNVYSMFAPDGTLLVSDAVLAKSNALLAIVMLNQPKEK